MSEIRFDERVAVVTGAGGGLGREYALLLAQRGAKVLVNDFGGGPDGSGGSAIPAQSVASEIEKAGGVASANSETVDTPEGGRAIVEQALDLWGRIDVLVNNAGIAGGGAFHEISTEQISKMIGVHVEGAYNVGRAAWSAMLEGGYGRVINTSSGSVFGIPGTSHYMTAKAGIIGFTRALALEGAPVGIKVNAVMPVAYSRLTAMLPAEDFTAWLRTHYGPERVAPFVAWLAHEGIPCTGEVFTVGGGRAARVFLGVVPGHTASPASPEAYRDHFDEVMSTEGYEIPGNSMEELGLNSGEIGWSGEGPPNT